MTVAKWIKGLTVLAIAMLIIRNPDLLVRITSVINAGVARVAALGDRPA